MFMRVGEVINGLMLCQVEPGVGKLIEVKTGNRYHEKKFELIYDIDDTRAYGYPFSKHEYENYIGILSSDTKAKKDVISFCRYIRSIDFDGVVDNMSGVTLLINLDYVNRIISFKYSICNGDNFDKKVGIAIANSKKLHSIKMPETGIPESGTVDFIMDSLFTGKTTVPIRDASAILTEYSFSKK